MYTSVRLYECLSLCLSKTDFFFAYFSRNYILEDLHVMKKFYEETSMS